MKIKVKVEGFLLSFKGRDNLKVRGDLDLYAKMQERIQAEEGQVCEI